jgi:heptosyltransferase-2
MRAYSMRDVTEGVKMNIPAKAWSRTNMPRRILAIRLQAMGDLVACLPYLQHLRRSIPENTQLDLLTTEETSSIPRHIDLFDNVYAIGGGRNFKKQVMHGALLLPSLLRNRYEVVLDLQNNSLSRFVRRSLLPRAWTAFDRYSPIAGGERYRLTIEAAGLGVNKADYRFNLKAHDNALTILKQNGWRQDDELVVLNPAAAFETRNWNLPNFVAFAALWRKEFPKARFLVLGTSFIEKKADWLKEQLGEQLINLTGKTTAFEAFAILQQVKMVLSEDSGLMHMAWCSGVPTMGLFGGTRTDWVRLLGDHTFFLDASDLACGGCMQATCRFGDVHCLARYSPEIVFYHARSLYQKMNSTI